MITTVLFDFYNTLYAAREWFELEAYDLPERVLVVMAIGGEVRADPATLEAVSGAYREIREGVHASGSEVSAAEGVRQAFETVNLPVPTNLDAVIGKLVAEAYFPGRETAGATGCVRLLAESGYRLGIVSNALCCSFLHRSLADSGIGEYFGGVFCSAEVGYYKSNPQLYLHAVEMLGATPEQTAHVGDSLRFDMEGAKAAGLRTVWYNPRREGTESEAADAAIARLEALPRTITRLSGIGDYMDAE